MLELAMCYLCTCVEKNYVFQNVTNYENETLIGQPLNPTLLL